MGASPLFKAALLDLDAMRVLQVECVLHRPSRVVLGYEQGVHVPACRLDEVAGYLGESHLEENRPDSVDQGLEGMRPPP